MKVIVIVKGHPRPQPRPRVVQGRAVSCADPLAAAWKAKIKSAVSQIPVELPKGPISCTMWFRMPTKDAARFNKAHTQVPDLDNLAKLVLDAIQDTGLLINDSQVARLNLEKTWSSLDASGVLVELETWEPQDQPQEMPRPDWIN
jgi:Holliday junction resolvase RusA-like endonuclease